MCNQATRLAVLARSLNLVANTASPWRKALHRIADHAVLVNLLAAAADCGVALPSRGCTTDVAARVAYVRAVEAAAAAATAAAADGTQLSYAPPSPKLLAAATAYRQFCDSRLGDIRKQ